MEFAFNETEEILRKAARDFLTNKCPRTLVREMEKDPKGYPPALWQEMAGLGWLGLVFPEEYGGGAATFGDLAVLLEEMGRACLPGPYLTAVIGGLCILAAGNESQKKQLLPAIGQGKLVVALALTEPAASYNASGISFRAELRGDDYVLNGTKLFVPDAHVADYLIVITRTGQPAGADSGITLFLVDAKSPGIKVTLLPTIADDKQCEVQFQNVRVSAQSILGEPDQGWPAVQQVLQKAAIAKCAEMVGGAQQVLDMTISYAKERVQFGKPIGSFQAIQHTCANMAMDMDGCRFITYQAAWMIGRGLPCAREAAVAKTWVSEAYRRIVASGIQVHGAIGFTKDHDMQLYFRRAKAGEVLFGDANFHREKIAQELGI